MPARSRQPGPGGGWLYVAAGLAICAAGVLISAQEDLAALRSQRDRLAEEIASGEAGLAAHRGFLDHLARRDPSLIRRLAASHLNMMPSGDRAMLLASSRETTIDQWIDESVVEGHRRAERYRPSVLRRLATGPHRIWLLGAGVLCVFVGLIIDPGLDPGSSLRRLVIPRWPAVLR